MRRTICIALLTASCGAAPGEVAIDQGALGAADILQRTVIPQLEQSTAFRSISGDNAARMAIVRVSIDRAVALLALSPPDRARAAEVLSSVTLPVLASTPGYRSVVAANPKRFFETKLGRARLGIADAIARLGAQADEARGAAAASSSVYGTGFEAAKAIDGDPATGWSPSGTDLGSWLQIDLGAPTLLRRIRVVTRQDLDQPVTRRSFQLWASNHADMSRGHAVLGGVGTDGLPFRGAFTLEVEDPNAYRYIALVKTAPEYFFVSEVQVYGTEAAAVGGGGVTAARSALAAAITNLQAATVFSRVEDDNVARMLLVRDSMRIARSLLALSPAETGHTAALLRTIVVPIFESSAGYRLVLATNPNRFAETKIGIARRRIDDALGALGVASPPPAAPTIWDHAGAFIWHGAAFPAGAGAPKMQNNHIAWVAILIHDGLNVDADSAAQLDAGWMAQYRSRGISVGAWGVNRVSPEQEAQLAASLIRQRGFDFYIANAEAEYKYTQPNGAWSPEAYGRSARFVAAFRGELPDLPAAVSSYGRTDLADIHWAAWRDGGFHYLPQTYWNESDIYQPRLAVDAAVASGWPRSRVHPTFGIWGGGARRVVTGDEYVNDLLGQGTLGFSIYLGEVTGDADWAAMGRGVSAGLARP